MIDPHARYVRADVMLANLTDAGWSMKRHHLSNRGTTRWDELCVVKAR